MNQTIFSILAAGIVLFSTNFAQSLGYEEGRNLHVDWPNLPNEEAAHAAAQDFKRNGVELIVAYENQSVRAAQAATPKSRLLFLLSQIRRRKKHPY